MACIRKGKYGKGYRIDWRDQDGNRYRKTFRTRQEADDCLTDTKQELKAGSFVPPKQIPTFAEVAEQWFREQQAQGLRPASLAFYQVHLDRHILPAIGDRRLDTIGVENIQKFRDRKRKAGLAPKTVNKLLGTVRAVFQFAVMRYRLSWNPAVNVKNLKLNGRELVGSESRNDGKVRPEDVLSPEEIRQLIEHAEAGYYQTLIMTAALTGARHDELLALQWHDVDFDKAEIHIRRSLSWARIRGEEYRPRFFPPKTVAGDRWVPCPAPLIYELKKWKLRCPASIDNLVFPKQDGTPVHRTDSLRYGLYPAIERAKLPRVDMHGLRHSFASNLIAMGRPVTEVQHLMGHAKPTTTLEVYAHWFRHRGDTADAVEALASKVVDR